MYRLLLLLTTLIAVVAVLATSQTLTSLSSAVKKPTANSLSSRIHGYVARTAERRRLAVTEATAALRFLQVGATSAPGGAATAAPDESSQCIDTTTVNFDDFFSQAVYGSAYQASCTCLQENNADDVVRLFVAPPNPVTATPGEIDEWTTNMNEVFGSIQGGYEYTCESGCAACIESETFCAYLSVSDKTSFSGRTTNFTYEELLDDLQDLDSKLVSDITITSETCMTYERGATGEVCFSIAVSGDTASSNEPLPNCTILYNDVPCNSCEYTTESDDDLGICHVADCTNVVPGANLDSCAITGFVDPFRFLLADTNIHNFTFTQGTCQPPLSATPNDNTVDAPTGIASTNGDLSSPGGGTSTTNGDGSTSSSGSEEVEYWSRMMAMVSAVMVAMAIGST